ncbi:hypothetical protein QF026_000621 [Streptomyces aurantiacus]|uniref:hypothetical protein n=1 Tax=Streptomyces aurantiacus TaxID=47760 RepID=UPI00279456B6|nr:hypothetical protein [Streptomyces aurantiacus]MDQ0772155.1 hypothetical protein [Streptomyces aurantiacus]
MRIFHRSPERDQQSVSRDAEYSFFSVDEGAQFRAHVREAFAERGLEVTVHSGTVSDNTGRQFGLRNLAAICHQEPRGRKRWPHLIRGHVGRLLRVVDGPSPLEFLEPDQLLALLRPWVVARDFIEPNADRYVHARVVAPGLCEVLALDLRESVMTLPDTSLAPLGDIVELRARALDNLRELPMESHTILHGPQQMHFDVVTGDSFFTSSRVLATNELARDLTGRPLGPDGALVAMPNRHQLALRPIDSERDTTLMPTLYGMTVFAAANYEDAVGPVSPDVYWWRDGTLTRLVRQEGVEPEFKDDIEFEMLQMRLADNDADQR